MKRTDPEMVEKYRKDATDELFLANLNSELRLLEECFHSDHPTELPSLYIVGVPRSGTTLLYQTVIAHLQVDYISNLTAAFWEAPTVGMRLSTKLLSSQAPEEFQSTYGRTVNPAGPHEFGYFWTKHLRYTSLKEPSDVDRDSVDWECLRQTIASMSGVNRHPIAFKPLMVGWYMARMCIEVPRSIFVWIRRDPVQNAISIHRMREEMLGSADQWMSMIPDAYEQLKDLPSWEQVAGQVWHIERGIQRQFDQLPNDRKLSVQYEEFCCDPASTLSDIADLLEGQGHRPETVSVPPSEFHQSRKDPESNPLYAKIFEAFGQFD